MPGKRVSSIGRRDAQMGDMQFDDFDVDALLDAQSSDDDGSDLPELGRSLDDILNDTELADIFGDSVSVKSVLTTSRIDQSESSYIPTNGQAATGLEGETIKNSRSGLKSRNWEKPRNVEKISLAGYAEGERKEEFSPPDELNDFRSHRSASTTEGLDRLPPSWEHASRIDRSQVHTEEDEGVEPIGAKRINTVSSNYTENNGRASVGTPLSISVLPQFSKSKSSPRPGAAFAAAAAASRLSGSPHSNRASRFTRSSYAPLEGSVNGASDNDYNNLEVGGTLPSEGSPSLAPFQDNDAAANDESFTSTLSSGAPEQNLQDFDVGIASAGVQEFTSDHGNAISKSDLRPDTDELHAAATADLNDNVEMLSTLVSQLNEQPSHSRSDDAELLPEGGKSEPVAGESTSSTVPSDSGYASDTLRESSASESESDTGVFMDHTTEPALQANQAEPELPGLISLNNWMEEPQQHAITSPETSPDFQLQRAQSLNLLRNSMHSKTSKQVADDIGQQQDVCVAETLDLSTREEKRQPTALQIAEELERSAASSGLHWEEGAVAQPMRLEGIQRGDPAIGLLQVDSGGSLSYALQSSALRREHGSPHALAVHSNFIAVGLSKGAILVIPSKYSATRSADETDAKPFMLATPGSDKSVSSMCFNQQGDLLLVGYSTGHLVLWDVPKANVIKTLEKEHTVAVVHTLFLGQEVPGARNFKTITSDSKGLTLLHTFTVLPVPVLRRYTVNTTCILDGQRTGIVLSISPLLPEEVSQIAGGPGTATHLGSSVPMNLSSVMGVVGGASGDAGRKFLYDGAPSSEESGGGVVVFVTHQVALVVRLLPAVEVCARLARPEGLREGAIPYTAWRRTKSKTGIPSGNLGSGALSNTSSVESIRGSTQKDTEGRPIESVQSQEDATVDGVPVKVNAEGGENCPSLAIAWDKKVLIYQLQKSELKFVAEWDVENPAAGVAWLEEQMMVVATSNDQLCLFTNEGILIERAVLATDHGGMGAFIYHTHFMNLYGNPEKAYHNAMAVRGAALYLLGPNRLWRARLLPWKDRIKALENAGDWMGAFRIAMEIYDGRSQGVTGLPKGLDAMREAIMPTLLALLSAYIDEAFAYLSLALGPSSSTQTMNKLPEPAKKTDRVSQKQQETFLDGESGVETSMQEMVVEAREQYARVGGVAIEFCVHIRKTEVLFENVFSKFEEVGQRGTFLELLEPYILKDMLGGLAPEVMQALVEHYSSRGWLNRVEQCVLHMDIGSLDFNQVVRVCRDHGLYSALIYLFTKGLDDFKSPLEELLAVAQKSSHASQAKAFGYKLLVYLKYCFTGLAFPPGNGSLASSRLPRLRAELLGYLLDPVERRGNGGDSVGADGQTVYPKLFYLLELDTQASLLVLGSAFPEDGPLGVGERNWLYPLVDIRPEQVETSNRLDPQPKGDGLADGEGVAEGLKLAQETVDAVIHVLETASSHVITTESDKTPICSEQQWPTHWDTADMLEFVAHFAAAKYAVVPAAIMSRILEHLTSPSVKGIPDLELSEMKKTILKQREDLMVALLRAVPKSQWDPEQSLQLAQKAGYWQVTALLHAQRCDYTAALDNYLKDLSRPQNPFTFISSMLSSSNELEELNIRSFREAVLSHLPELIQLSTFSTLLVVLDHFSSENPRILKELTPHPKLLFNYLKAVMNIRSRGQDCSESELEKDFHSVQLSALGESLDRNERLAFPGPGEERIENYTVLDSEVYLADMLQRSGLEFTDEMAETFVELLCRFEPKSVKRFLERYENYRLEHCLKLCQEYGITDAAAFLLERVGDVSSALSLVLADLHVCMQNMDQALAHLVKEKFRSTDGEESLDLTEVVAVHSVLHAAVHLCQRNTFRLEPQESESLWFRLLDRFVEPLHSLNKHSKASRLRKQRHVKSELSHHTDQERLPIRSSMRWKVWGSDVASKLLRKILVQFIGDIVNGMMGFVPLPVILNKILEDHCGHEFGDFKATILDMLSAYGFERTILGTAKLLIEHDTFQNVNALKRGCTHGFTPSYATCSVCGYPLDGPAIGDVKSRKTSSAGSSDRPKTKLDREGESSSHVSQQGIQIFPCGHAAHVSCVVDLSNGSASGRGRGAMVCPICCYKSKPVDLSWHDRGSSLLKAGLIIGGGGKGKAVTSDSSKQGNTATADHVFFGQSRLQLLKHLEEGTDLHDLGPSLKLKLAPVLTPYARENLPNGSSTRGKGNTKSSSAMISQRKSKSRT